MFALSLIIASLAVETFAPPLRGRLYLDPGSGSFILQLLVATLLGGLFLVKAYWQKLVGFFRSKFSKRDDTEE